MDSMMKAEGELRAAIRRAGGSVVAVQKEDLQAVLDSLAQMRDELALLCSLRKLLEREQELRK